MAIYAYAQLIFNGSEYRLCMICIISITIWFGFTFFRHGYEFLCGKGQFSSWYASRSNAGHIMWYN